MSTDHSILGPAQRLRDLDRMRSEAFDIVVIGGGVTGTGIALDAALRGLKVALVEQRDYASGTSSRSSKLFHGGLRYLEQLDFGLVREALRERNLMLTRLCPHLAEGVPFLYPLTHKVWERAYVGAGIALYDLLAAVGRSPLPRHRHLSKRAAHAIAPALAETALEGAIQYWDAQVDDARHTMTLARTAAQHGAALASSTRVTGLMTAGPHVRGVQATDLESGDALAIQGRQVINATGVWTDQIEDHVGGGAVHVRASKGVHILVPKERIDSDSGIITRTKSSVLFVIPWRRHWIIGTTDTDWNLDLAHPAASRSDIDYLLTNVNRILRSPITHEDVVGVYAGLRPLLRGETEATSKLSREHAVVVSAPGLISVAGGKYTTYRVMAEDAVDEAAKHLDIEVLPSITEATPLVGAVEYESLRRRTTLLADEYGLDATLVSRLVARYGDRALDVLEIIRSSPKLATPLSGAEHHIGAEIRYAASHEGALHLDDVLTRRTRISIETPHRGAESAEAVAQILAPVLGWTGAVIEREVEHYLARVRAELDSQAQRDDRTADAARLGAPDVRGFSG